MWPALGVGKHMLLVRKPEGKRPRGGRRHKWVYNIKTDFKGIAWEGVD